jgi:alpha-L-rhamnosidase
MPPEVAMLSPTRLRCEYLADPLAVDTPAPRLSWELESTTPAARGERQSAYRIVVRRTSGTRPTTVWDTGVVKSADTSQIEYRGKQPESCARYQWKVRVWDARGAASAWSAEASWTMGPGGPGWAVARAGHHPPGPAATWIGAPLGDTWDEQTAQPSPMLRRVFTLKTGVRRAVVWASALGLYELHLNGSRVGSQELAPEWTDYRKRAQYQGYDVTALLRPGDNALGAILAPGWYAGQIGLANHFMVLRRGHYGRQLRMAAWLHVELDDGTTETVLSDPSWKVTTEGPLRASDLQGGETYDARREMAGWDTPVFDDTAWKPVFCRIRDLGTRPPEPLEPRGPVLSAQPAEPVRVTRELATKALTEPNPGVWVFDFGQNMAGRVRLRVQAPAGTDVRLRHAEVLNPDGTLYRVNLRLDDKEPRWGALQEDHYICRGGGVETWEPSFTFHGFRYLEVTGLPGKPRLEDAVARVVHSDAPTAGTFHCSDDLLNRIMSAVSWTQDSNLISVPTDCPQRNERLGWCGDIQVFSQTAMFNRDMAAFFTKWLRDLREAQTDDGRLPDFAPHPLEPEARYSGNPGWADAGTVIPWRMWTTYGDRRVLTESFEAARRWVDWSVRHNPDLLWRSVDGLAPAYYGDWLNSDTFVDIPGMPRGKGEVPKEVFSTAWFAHSAQLVSRMAGVLGRAAEQKNYADLARRIRLAFNKAYVSKDGRILGDTQAGYALALSFELLGPAVQKLAFARLLKAFKPFGGALSTGILSTIRMLMELTRRGRVDEAYRLVLRREMPSWGYMVEHGGTTIWERWDGWVEGRGFQNPSMNSFSHYAIGAVGEWVWRVVAGINPVEEAPGCARLRISPMPGGGLTSAEATWRCIRGVVRVAWEQGAGGDGFSLEVTIPPNVTAEVVVPEAKASAVTEGGVPAAKAPGVRLLGPRAGGAAFEVGSGRYRFEATR